MTTKTNLHENLKKLLLLHHGLSLSSLAKKTNIPQPTLHHILEGKTKNPRPKVIAALAKFFNVSVDEIKGHIPLTCNLPENLKKDLQITAIPVLSTEQIKNLEYENIAKSHNNQEIIINAYLSNQAFAFKIDNFDFEPVFKNGSVLIFEPQKTIGDRDMVLIYLPKSNTFDLKRVFIENNNIKYLKHDLSDGNANLIQLKLDEHKIIAPLIEARIPF